MYSKTYLYILLSLLFANVQVACAAVQADTPAAVQTDTPLYCIVTGDDLNIRIGPSVEHIRVSYMLQNTQFVVSKRNANADWLFGRDMFSDNEGWASAAYLDCGPTGVNELPIAEQERPNLSAILAGPLDNKLSGREVFTWTIDGGSLREGEEVQIVFWPIGGIAKIDGRGIAPPTTASSYEVNLDKLAEYEQWLSSGREYYWGIVLLRDGVRIQSLNSGHKFYFEIARETGPSDDPVPPIKLPKDTPVPNQGP